MNSHASKIPIPATNASQTIVADRDEFLRVAAVTWVAGFGVGMVILFSLIQGIAGQWDLVLQNQVSLVAFGAMLAFNHTGRCLLARIILSLYIHGIILYYLWFLGSEIGLGHFFYGLFALPFVLFGASEKKWVLASCVLTLATCLIYEANRDAWQSGQLSLSAETIRCIQATYRFTSFIAALTPPMLLFFLTESYRRRVRSEQARVIEAAKMSSLGEMAAGMAHEVNNPLTVIIGTAENISRKIGGLAGLEKTGIKSDLNLIMTTGYRIAKIIKALLTYSRDSQDDPKDPMPIGDIIRETLSLSSERFHAHNVALRHSVPAGRDGIILCRPGQIEQVLINLLNNAFDAVVGTDSPWIELGVELKPQFVEIRVTDSGQGIPPGVAKRMMDPFFTTKRFGRGIGLGLSLSRAIALDHGGALVYDANASHTTFILTLPRTDEPGG